MNYFKFDVDEKRSIEVYDGLFDAKEMYKFYNFAQKSEYSLQRTSTGFVEHKSLATLKCDLSLGEALRLGLFKSPNFKELLERISQKELRLERSYINLCTSDDLFPYHVDDYDEDGLTMLYYMNTEWQPMWEGETHFANETMDDIIFSSAFIPGRLAVFNPTIPHKSSQPSRYANQFRFTYAMKFISKKDPNWEKAINLKEHI